MHRIRFALGAVTIALALSAAPAFAQRGGHGGGGHFGGGHFAGHGYGGYGYHGYGRGFAYGGPYYHYHYPFPYGYPYPYAYAPPLVYYPYGG